MQLTCGWRIKGAAQVVLSRGEVREGRGGYRRAEQDGNEASACAVKVGQGDEGLRAGTRGQGCEASGGKNARERRC